MALASQYLSWVELSRQKALCNALISEGSIFQAKYFSYSKGVNLFKKNLAETGTRVLFYGLDITGVTDPLE